MIIDVHDFGCFKTFFSDPRCLLVAFVGYERRSTALLRCALDVDSSRVFCWTPAISDTRLSYFENVNLCKSAGLQLHEFSLLDLEDLFRAFMKKAGDCGFSIIAVDYSSLPRVVYTYLLQKVLSGAASNLSFWYANGRYFEDNIFPCVGVGDWKLIEDQGRVDSEFRSTVIGLGYDWTRTYGILDKINPQEVYSFSASIDKHDDVATTVRIRNEEIVALSQNFVCLPVSSFSSLYYGVRDFVIRLLDEGDVEVIPDGPKPLVFAMTAVALSVSRTGIFCWHISHAPNARTLDVTELSPLQSSGFSLTIRKSTTS